MRRLSAIAAACCAAGLLAACGDDESTSGSGAGSREDAFNETLLVKAEELGSGEYAYDPSELSVQAGTVRIEFENPSSSEAPHNIAIEGNGSNASGKVIDPGNTTEVDAELEAGEYTYYCVVGDHRQEGMEGTLTVE